MPARWAGGRRGKESKAERTAYAKAWRPDRAWRIWQSQEAQLDWHTAWVPGTRQKGLGKVEAEKLDLRASGIVSLPHPMCALAL